MRSLWLFCILAFALSAQIVYAGVIYFITTSHTEPGYINTTDTPGISAGTYWGNWFSYYNKSFNGTNDTPYVYVHVNSTVDIVTNWVVLAADSSIVYANDTVNSTGWARLNMTGLSLPINMKLWAAKGIDMQNSFIIANFPSNGAPTYLVNGSDRFDINITEPKNATQGFVQGVYRIHDNWEQNKIFGTFSTIPYLIDSPFWPNNTMPTNLSYDEIGIHSHNGFYPDQQFGFDVRANATDELDCFKTNASLRQIGSHNINEFINYFGIVPTSHASGNGALFPSYNSLDQVATWNELGIRVDATVWAQDTELSSTRVSIRNVAYTCYHGTFNSTNETATNGIPRGPYYFNGATNVTNGTRGMVEVFIAYRNGSYISDKYSTYGSMSGFLNESYFRAQRNNAEYIFPTFLHSPEVINETGGGNDTSPNTDISNLNLTIRLAKQYRAIFLTQSAVIFHPRSTETAAVAAQRIPAVNSSTEWWIWRVAVRNTNASQTNNIMLSPEWSRNDSFNITLAAQDVVELVYACEPYDSFSNPRFINKSAQPYMLTTGNVTINRCTFDGSNFGATINGTGTNKVAYIYFNTSKDFNIFDDTKGSDPVVEVRNNAVGTTRSGYSATYNATSFIVNLTVPTMSLHVLTVKSYTPPVEVLGTVGSGGNSAPVTAFSAVLNDGSSSRDVFLDVNESYSTPLTIENKGNTNIAVELQSNVEWADVIPKSITLLPGQKKEVSVSIGSLREGSYAFKVLVKVGDAIKEISFNVHVGKKPLEKKQTLQLPTNISSNIFLFIAGAIVFAFLFFVFRRWLVVKW